jgi:hypothetical protein
MMYKNLLPVDLRSDRQENSTRRKKQKGNTDRQSRFIGFPTNALSDLMDGVSKGNASSIDIPSLAKYAWHPPLGKIFPWAPCPYQGAS